LPPPPTPMTPCGSPAYIALSGQVTRDHGVIGSACHLVTPRGSASNSPPSPAFLTPRGSAPSSSPSPAVIDDAVSRNSAHVVPRWGEKPTSLTQLSVSLLSAPAYVYVSPPCDSFVERSFSRSSVCPSVVPSYCDGIKHKNVTSTYSSTPKSTFKTRADFLAQASVNVRAKQLSKATAFKPRDQSPKHAPKRKRCT
jgi:hypothetical protein